MKLKKYLLLMSCTVFGVVSCDSEIPNEEPIEPVEPSDPQTPGSDVDISSVLSSLQTSPFVYQGTYTVNSANYQSELVGYISQDRYYYTETIEEVEVDTKDYVRDNNGYAAVNQIDLVTNRPALISTGELFDTSYFNPFTLLEENGGTVSEDVVTFDISSSVADTILFNLSGKTIESYSSVSLEVNIDSSSNIATSATLSFDSDVKLSLTLLDESSVTLPSDDPTPRESTNETSGLNSFISSIGTATVFTATYSLRNLETNDYVAYSIGVAEDRFQAYNISTYSGFGAIDTDEGLLEFSIENTYNFQRGEPTPGVVAKDLIPIFDISGHMFDYTGEQWGTLYFDFAFPGRENEITDKLIERLIDEDLTIDEGTFSVEYYTGLYMSYSYTSNSTYSVSVQFTGVNTANVDIGGGIFEDNDTNRYFVDTFGDSSSLNYTMERTTGSRTYEYDSSSSTVGSLTSSTSDEETIVYITSNVLRYGEENTEESYYYVNGQYYGSTPYTYTDGTYVAGTTTIYTWQAMFNNMTDLVYYLPSFVASGDDVLVCSGSETIVPTVAQIMWFEPTALTWSNYDATVTLLKDGNGDVVSVEVDIVYATEVSATEYKESFVKARIKDIGSTTIDTSILGI